MNNVMNSLNETYNTKIELKKKLDAINPYNNANGIISQYPSILKKIEYISIFYTIMKNNINLSNFYSGRSTVPENVDFSNVKVPKNVKSLSGLLANCNNLKTVNMNGFDFNEVDDASGIYRGCSNLVSVDFNNVNFNNIKDISEMCYDCYNLTGSPVCGDNVTNMNDTYYNCYNLTGSPVCGPNVTNMYEAYYSCPNLYGNSYFYSKNVSNMCNCFCGRNTSNMLNIYVYNNSTTMNTCLYTDASSMVGANITWVYDNNRYYNTSYNIYIYPVEDVYNARINNGD